MTTETKNQKVAEESEADAVILELPARPKKRRNPASIAKRVRAQRGSGVPVPSELELSELIS